MHHYMAHKIGVPVFKYQRTFDSLQPLHFISPPPNVQALKSKADVQMSLKRKKKLILK